MALAASCRFGQVATLCICLFLVVIGLPSDFFFGQHHLAGKGLLEQPSLAAQCAWLAYRCVPNLGVFWVTDALGQERPITGTYVLSVALYAVLYLLAILMVAIAVFQRREVG